MGILILDSLTAGQTREAGTFLLAKSRGLQPLHLYCTAMGEVSECLCSPGTQGATCKVLLLRGPRIVWVSPLTWPS